MWNAIVCRFPTSIVNECRAKIDASTRILGILRVVSASVRNVVLLWPPYVIGQAIILLPCDFYLSFFFSSPNLSGRILDVYHTSAHSVALVRI